MKILVFIPCFTYGGAEKQAALLAHHLCRQGHDVTVWGFPSPTANSPLLDDLLRDGIRCQVLPSWPKLNWSFSEHGGVCGYLRHRFWTWPSSLRDYARMLPPSAFDAVVPFTVLPCLVAALFAKTIQTGRLFWNHRGGYDDAGVIYSDFIVREVLRQQPTMVANSTAGAQFLTDTFGVAPDQVTVIHNIFPEDAALSQLASQRKYHWYSGQVLQLLHVANLFVEKDIMTVLAAVKQLQSMGFPSHLHIAGFFVEQNKYVSFLEYVSRNRLEQVVTYHGSVNQAKLQELLRFADIGLLSSRSEGMPNSVMEYMYAALPVIGSDIPGIRELLGENGDSWLFPVGDAATLAQLVSVLGGDPEARKVLGQTNRSRILRDFSSDKLLPVWGRILDCDPQGLPALAAGVAGNG